MAGLASLVIAAGLLAAVVPVSAGADTPSQQFPPVNEPGVTSTQINVGGVVAKTNPLGGDYAAAFNGVQAYFNMVNASKDKGIYGRKLNLSSKRDDQVGMNRQEVQGLISEDNVFAVLPVATLLFTGADLLGQSGIPTFGWNINAEWGSEQAAGPPNLFGEKGSFLCFTCPTQTLPWLAQKLHKKKIGVLAYQVPQSADCAKGVQFVLTCVDLQESFTLAKEMKKQGLNANQYLPNAYNQKFISENAPFFQGSYALTFFTPFEVKQKPPGLKDFQKWMKKGGFEQNENAMAGWINADQFVTGLKEAGPDFSRQKLVDAINAEKNFTANGLLAGIDWSVAHQADQAQGCTVLSKIDNGKFVPSFGQTGKPFVCFQLNPLPDKLQSQPTLKG